MHRRHAIFAAASILAVGLGSVIAAGGSTLERMSAPYETIRQALLHDRTDGVAGNARAIAELAGELVTSLDAETAGVSPARADDLRALLPSIREAAANLAATETLDEARAAFGVLSHALVQYRQMAVVPSPAVAYCSMAGKVWMQPKGEIGNPYFGQSMPRCGEFVSEKSKE